MEKQAQLELSPAAWFFAGESGGDTEHHSSVAIQTPFRVGRKSDLDLCLPCQNVSGLHAEIVQENGRLYLVDLDSTNGTFVNGERVTSRVELSEDDTIQFGTAVFRLSKSGLTGHNIPTPSSCESPAGEFDLSSRERLERLFNEGVVPFFQPIVDLSDDVCPIIGYEVLGRSRLFGLRTPAEMFAAATKLKLEAELSRVLRNQGLEVANKNLGLDKKLFVNTHPAELKISGLEESLFEIREKYPDRSIVIEFHESVLNQPGKFLRLRSTLENLDIELAIHDLGAGQTRLANLSEIRPNLAKFDVKLIRGLDRATQEKQKFLASLVKMMKELGITPMAECIEKKSEHQAITEIGFEIGQGYHYGRPCSIGDCNTPAAKNITTFEMPAEVDESKPVAHASEGTPNDAEWLLMQPEDSFTIQVMSAISEERAYEHIVAQETPEDFAVFCKQGTTRKLYIVCCGIYKDRAAAKAAAEQISDATISPWIRMLSSIQAEIKASKG